MIFHKSKKDILNGNIPEQIKYTWGIPEVEDFIANKWGIFIIAGIMILDVKRIAKKQRKEEKKTKEVNARVRWKRLTTAIKTLAVSIIWGMVIVYIVQNAMGKQIENGINYIAVTFLIILAISFVDKIIASLLKNRRKIKA